MEDLFYILILIVSVVAHEVAHGFVAYRFGDSTAKMAGRLSLNPIKHIDIVGSILIPLVLIISKAGFVFGWAKPVPVNPKNLIGGRKGVLAVASAGIIVNLGIALIFSLFVRAAPTIGIPSEVVGISLLIVIVNIMLAFFNAIPVPPLDGAGILFSLLPARFAELERRISAFAFPLLLLFIFFIWPLIAPLPLAIFRFLTGFDLSAI